MSYADTPGGPQRTNVGDPFVFDAVCGEPVVVERPDGWLTTYLGEPAHPWLKGQRGYVVVVLDEPGEYRCGTQTVTAEAPT